MDTLGQIGGSRPRARGALSNVPNRFDRLSYAHEADGWDHEEELPPLRTQVQMETARSLITYNKSPDLPFDRSINPYRGCEHGCVYCFARPTHSYLGLSPGLDFETKLIARPNAAQVLTKELRKKTYIVAPVAIGTNTDPYQPVERDLKLMRQCLQVLSDSDHPVAIVTKGTLIERDLDILAPMAHHGLLRVGVSITSLDPELSRKMEPRAPSPKRRLQIIHRLTQAGVPVRIMASPMVPGLSDHELENILSEAAKAGATSASWIMLRLPQEVSGLWQDWLAKHYPNQANKVMAHLRDMHGGKEYDARWGHRMRGQGTYAQMIHRRFKVITARLGLDERQPDLRRDLFKRPKLAGDQLSLFSELADK